MVLTLTLNMQVTDFVQSPGFAATLSDIFRENSRKVITRLAICRENFH